MTMAFGEALIGAFRSNLGGTLSGAVFLMDGNGLNASLDPSDADHIFIGLEGEYLVAICPQRCRQ